MAIGVMDFPLLTPQQTNPAAGTLGDIVAKRLAIAKMQGEELKAPYAGLGEMSKIRSQNAYSNAVMPQFQAKLLENPLIFPNVKDPQQRANLLMSLGANMGSSNQLSTAIDRQLASIYNGQQGSKSLLDRLSDNISSAFGNAPPEQSQMAQQIAQSQQMPQSIPQVAPQGMGQTVVSNPNAGAAGGYSRTPENVQAGQNIADFRRQTEKGTSQGKQEGEQQAEYGESVASGIKQQRAAEYFNKVAQKPELRSILNVPFAQRHALSWYKNSGNPVQKKAVGEYLGAMNSFATSALGLFKGRATNLDFNFIRNDLKPSANDTLDVNLGKMTALETMVNGQLAQDQAANKYMAQGYSKADAEVMANQDVDMNAIREKAYNQAFPPNVKVMTPRGVIELPPEGAKQLLRDHPEMHKVVG